MQAATQVASMRASEIPRSSQRQSFDTHGRASSSSTFGGAPITVDKPTMTRAGAPMPPPQSSQQSYPQNEIEKARVRSKVDELQAIADRQAADLRRRNEELLDLQRNHEAFREKFILFREGMRSKTDESDARFRTLEAELKLNNEQLATIQTQPRNLSTRASTAGVEEGALRVLEEEGEQLTRHKAQLSQEWQTLNAGGGISKVHEEISRRDSVIKDLRTRAENQAEYIRTQTAKLEEHTQQNGAASHAEARMKDLRTKIRDAEERNSGQLTALKQQQEKVGNTTQHAQQVRHRAGLLTKQLEDSQNEGMGMRQDINSQKSAHCEICYIK